MKKLALLLLLSSRASVCNTAPPAQQPEAEVHEPGAALSASAAAKSDADIGGPNGEAPPPPPAPTDAFQAVSATLGGSTWEIKGAGTMGTVQGDGTVVVTLANYNVDCAAHTPGPGDKVLTFTIPWEKGAKVDIATLKGKAIVATTFDEKKKKLEPLKQWKPSGTIQVVAAPTKGKSSGRIKIHLENKLDVVEAELPVKFCFPG